MQNKKKPFSLFWWNFMIVVVLLGTFYYLGHKEVLTVETIALNVRSGPSIQNDIQAQVKKGDKLVVLEKENNWYKVKLPNNKIGWVAGWLLDSNTASAATNVSAIVNTDGVNMRADASTNSQVLTELKINTPVIVTSESNGWSAVQYNDQTGWIHSTLLDLDENEMTTESNELYAREDSTNIRQQPDSTSSIVTKINYGDSIKRLETVGDWYKVSTTDGKTGYIANWVVSYTKPDEKTKAATSIAESVIMLDAGHGGEDVGAETSNGKYEKTATLGTVKALQKKLEATGAKVVLTRSKDETVSLKDRVLLSNQVKPDVFISIHYDSTEEKNVASGTTTYYYDTKRDKSLAKIVNQHLTEDLPLENRGYEYNDLYVTRENTQASLLLELGYLNNDVDSTYAFNSSYHKKVATAITQALTEYFK